MREVKYRLSATDVQQHNTEQPSSSLPLATLNQVVPFIITELNADGSVNGNALIGTTQLVIFTYTDIVQGTGPGQWFEPVN